MKHHHPNWKGGFPKCAVCNKTLANRYAKHCRSHRPLSEKTRQILRYRARLNKGKGFRWKKGQPAWNKGKPAPWLMGNTYGFKKGDISYPKLHPEIIPRGDVHYAWKGDKVKYRALHTWVQKQLGVPDRCHKCKRSGLSGRKIQWANKSGKYLRKLSDWIRLCVSCHKSYDLKRLSRKDR